MPRSVRSVSGAPIASYNTSVTTRLVYELEVVLIFWLGYSELDQSSVFFLSKKNLSICRIKMKVEEQQKKLSFQLKSLQCVVYSQLMHHIYFI